MPKKKIGSSILKQRPPEKHKLTEAEIKEMQELQERERQLAEQKRAERRERREDADTQKLPKAELPDEKGEQKGEALKFLAPTFELMSVDMPEEEGEKAKPKKKDDARKFLLE
jgi:hypothetical protein